MCNGEQHDTAGRDRIVADKQCVQRDFACILLNKNVPAIVLSASGKYNNPAMLTSI